jgi:phage head maturation protease
MLYRITTERPADGAFETHVREHAITYLREWETRTEHGRREPLTLRLEWDHDGDGYTHAATIEADAAAMGQIVAALTPGL